MRWCRRRPAIAGLLVGLFLSLTLGLLGVTFFWRQAESSAAAARVAQGNAETSAKAAVESRNQAEENFAAARASLYRSWMNLAAVHLDHGDMAGVREILARTLAEPDMRERRGFEWHYYDALTAWATLISNPGDIVRHVAVSRDGALCASIGDEQEIRVWDTQTGELVQTLKGTEKFTALDFSPTTLDVASGSVNGYVRLWRPLRDGRALQEIKHGPHVALVRFSPDGGQLASVGLRGAVRLWNADDLKLLAEIPSGNKSDVKSVRFTEGGKTLIVATNDGLIRGWIVSKAIELNKPETADFEFQTLPELLSMAVSDDGRLLAVGTSQATLGVYSLGGNQKSLRRTIWGRFDEMEFLVGSDTIAAVCSDGLTHLVDLEFDRELRTLSTHSSFGPGSLSRSSDGFHLVVGNGDGSMTKWNSDQLMRPAIYWQDDRTIEVRDVEFLPDGRHVVAAYAQGPPKLWDLTTGKSQKLGTESPGILRTLSVQPHGDLVAAAGNRPTIEIVDPAQRKVVRKLPANPDGAWVVQFSPDGKRLVVATRAGPIKFMETEGWTVTREMPGPRDPRVNAVTFSTDGRLLATARADGRVVLTDAETGTPSGPSMNVKGEPLCLVFCDGDRLLAVGTTMGEIHVWEVRSGRERSVMKGHTGRISAMVVLDGGKTLVTGGRDRNIKLWDVASGEFITSLHGHEKQVFALGVSPDGKTLASGGLEGEVRIWPSERENAIEPRTK